MAVSPLSSTASMSAPRSSSMLTASSASISSPASSSGSVVPRPAAAISGVDPVKFGSSGSAPSSASSCISATSERSAANRNGVAPSASRREDVFGTFGVPLGRRRLTSAPRFTISRTNSRLVKRPDPIGAGSLPSLESGLRTQVSVWSGVNPERRSFGSAPRSTSAIASSKWPFCTASSNGLVSRAAGLYVYLMGLPVSGRCKDRKSTRLNSSHSQISYAVFCLKKKKQHLLTFWVSQLPLLICILSKPVITSCSVAMLYLLHLQANPLMTLTTVPYLSTALISCH